MSNNQIQTKAVEPGVLNEAGVPPLTVNMPGNKIYKNEQDFFELATRLCIAKIDSYLTQKGEFTERREVERKLKQKLGSVSEVIDSSSYRTLLRR